MEDSEFDKLFADKIRGAGAPDLSEEDWEHLSPLLQAEQRKRLRAVPMFWLGALGALLLFSNMAWWWMWYQSKEDTKSLRSEWQQFQHQGVTLRDTTWTKVQVYQYDTIYKTMVYRLSPENAGQNGFVSGLMGNGFVTPLTQKATDAAQMPDLGTRDKQVSVTSENAIVSLDTTAQQKGWIVKQKAFLANLPLKEDSLQISAPNEIVAPQHNLPLVTSTHTKAPRQPILQPRSFRVGAGAGLIVPSAKGLSKTGGYTTYLAGELVFSDELALTLQGAYSGVTFQGTVDDPTLGIVPPQASPGNDYVLKYFNPEEGLKPYLQLSLGMRYWFVAKQKISPYFGLGYAMQWHLPYELQVVYHDQVSGNDDSNSLETSPINPTVSMLNFNTGVRYRFWKHFNWQTGITYDFKVDPKQKGIPRFWGLESGLLYGF